MLFKASNRKKNESDTNANKLFLDHVAEVAVVIIILFSNVFTSNARWWWWYVCVCVHVLRCFQRRSIFFLLMLFYRVNFSVKTVIIVQQKFDRV